MQWSTLYQLLAGDCHDQPWNFNTQWNSMVDRKKWELLSLTGMAELSHLSSVPIDRMEHLSMERGTLPKLCSPFLHLLPGNLLSDHLESIKFVRVLHFDWVDALVCRAKAFKKNEVGVTGGLVQLHTCQDSTKAMMTIIKHLLDNVFVAPKIEEFEVLLPDNKVVSPTERIVPLGIQQEEKKEEEKMISVETNKGHTNAKI